MTGCCDGEGYQAVFSDRFAKRVSKRYRKRGLNATATRMVDFLSSHGVEGATVLEIGGGVGEIQLELLRRGAVRVTNLEISTNYEAEATHLLQQSGMGQTDRVSRRFLDIARSPDDVEPADVVVLHRVVCCYPDHRALLSAAGSHARRLLVFSHPPRNVLTRGVVAAENATWRLKGQDFRGFVHPPDEMVAALAATGLRPTYGHHGMSWHVVGLER